MIFQKLNLHEMGLKFFKKACKVYEALLGPKHISTAGWYAAALSSANP